VNPELDHVHIHKVLSGDKEAFRYFTKTYHKMAYSIAISVVKDEDDAKDVVQNSFIRVYKCLRSFRQDAKFSTWLYKIVVNEALKHSSKSKKSKELITSIDDSHQYMASINEAIINFDLNDRNKQIEKVLLRMNSKEALVLKLFYLHEESIVEVENITGFTKGNIKVLLHRARKSFSMLFIQLK
jgi:RNA polymerase sigma-70 factor (ECF subfamily)